jgi:hypothetical protein
MAVCSHDTKTQKEAYDNLLLLLQSEIPDDRDRKQCQKEIGKCAVGFILYVSLQLKLVYDQGSLTTTE